MRRECRAREQGADEVRRMAEIAIVIGVQAVVMGTVAGLNYSNTSGGFGSWMQPRTQEEPAAENAPKSDVELSQQPHNTREMQNVPTPAAAAADAAVTKKTDLQVHARLGDFEEDMEFAYD